MRTKSYNDNQGQSLRRGSVPPKYKQNILLSQPSLIGLRLFLFPPKTLSQRREMAFNLVKGGDEVQGPGVYSVPFTELTLFVSQACTLAPARPTIVPRWSWGPAPRPLVLPPR